MTSSEAPNVKPGDEVVHCGECGRRIEICCCDETDCRHPSCDHCMRVRLGEVMTVVHTHGG